MTPISSVDVRWMRATKRTKLLKMHRKDDADFTWIKPLEEYKAEKAAKDAEGVKEPHMLHCVWRTKPLAGRPWWEKQIMEKFGLDGNHVNIP